MEQGKLIDPNGKVSKTTNKTSCPSPNLQNQLRWWRGALLSSDYD